MTFTITMDEHTARTLALLLNGRGVTATVESPWNNVRDSRKFQRTITIAEAGRPYVDGFIAGIEHVARGM